MNQNNPYINISFGTSPSNHSYGILFMASNVRQSVSRL